MDWSRIIEFSNSADPCSWLDGIGEGSRHNQVRWLRLLRTDVIEGWFRGGARARSSWRPDQCAGDEAVLALLLERHVLSLANRRAPQPLIDFWHWTARDLQEYSDLWQAKELIDTFRAPTIPEQERRFGHLLAEKARFLRHVKPLSWAASLLNRLADERSGNRASGPRVRVVYAWRGGRPAVAFRSGLLVEFRLLAQTTASDLCSEPQVFDDSFLRSLALVRDRLGADNYFKLEHDWEFLPSGTLEDVSGTTAIYLGQLLASRGWFEAGTYLTLPPWLVITAPLDPRGPHSGGTPGEVGLLDEKAVVLREEGVRVLVTASLGEDDLDRKAWPCAISPGEDDLRREPNFRGNVVNLANKLRAYLQAADVEPLEHRVVKPPLDEELAHAEEHLDAHLRIDLKDDYVPPTYAFRALRHAIQELPGKGYIHLTAPKMMGKSVLVRALRERWVGTPEAVGATLRYVVLHGSCENPWLFLDQVIRQARNLDPSEVSLLYHKRLSEVDPLQNRQRTPCEIRASIAKVLELVRGRFGDQIVILAVDGLDELTVRSDSRGRIDELLPAPASLATGCYVLLTSRPGLRLEVREVIEQTLRAGDIFREIPLGLETPGYLELLGEFLVRSLGETVRRHIDGILAHAQRRFLWVRLLRDLLRGRDLSAVSAGELMLPEGDDIFPAHLAWMAENVRGGRERFQTWHRPILLLVAAAYEPVGRVHLRHWLNDRDWGEPGTRGRLEVALTELKPFLDDETAVEADETIYRIGHREVIDWLERCVHANWAGAIDRQGHHRIVTTSSDFFQVDLNNLKGRPPRLILYNLAHLPGHLLHLGRFEEAAQTISDTRCFFGWHLESSSEGFYDHKYRTLATARVAQFERLARHDDSFKRYSTERLGLFVAYVNALAQTATFQARSEPKKALRLFVELKSICSSIDGAVFDDVSESFIETAEDAISHLWILVRKVESDYATCLRDSMEYHLSDECYSQDEAYLLAAIQSASEKLARSGSGNPRLRVFSRRLHISLSKTYLNWGNLAYHMGSISRAIELTRNALALHTRVLQDEEESLSDRSGENVEERFRLVFQPVTVVHDAAKASINLARQIREHLRTKEACETALSLAADAVNALQCHLRKWNEARRYVDAVENSSAKDSHGQASLSGEAMAVYPSLAIDLIRGVKEIGIALYELDRHEESFAAFERGFTSGMRILDQFKANANQPSVRNDLVDEFVLETSTLLGNASASMLRRGNEQGHLVGWKQYCAERSLAYAQRAIALILEFKDRGHSLIADQGVNQDVLFAILDGDPVLSNSLGLAYMNAGNSHRALGDHVIGLQHYLISFDVLLGGLAIAGGSRSTTAESRAVMANICDCAFNILTLCLRTGRSEWLRRGWQAARYALGHASEMCRVHAPDGLDERLVNSVQDLDALVERLTSQLEETN